MVADPTKQIDPLRQTGRTTRMLEKAQTEGFYASVYSGLPVLIVCASYSECERIGHVFLSMASARGFVVSCIPGATIALTAPGLRGEILEARYRFMSGADTFSHLVLGRDWANVYFDHYAHEYAARKRSPDVRGSSVPHWK